MQTMENIYKTTELVKTLTKKKAEFLSNWIGKNPISLSKSVSDPEG